MILKWTIFENTKQCDYSCLSLKRANKAQWICHLSIHGSQGDRLHCWRRSLCPDQIHAQVSWGQEGLVKNAYDIVDQYLSSFGMYNKILETGWLIKDRNVFLTFLEARNLETMVPTWLAKGPLPDHRLLILSSYGGRGDRSLWSTNPTQEGSAHKNLSKASPSNAITLGIRSLTYEFWADTKFRTQWSSHWKSNPFCLALFPHKGLKS